MFLEKLTNQILEISKCKSIPPADVLTHIKQKMEDKRKLDGEVNVLCIFLNKIRLEYRLKK
ncbi:MAG: hypothetical protein WAM14_03275 [Candidatus Nitrosopolaris sp.]